MNPDTPRTVQNLRADAITAVVHLMHGPRLPDDVATAVALLAVYAQELAAVLPVLATLRHTDACYFRRPTGAQPCTCGLLELLANVPSHLFPDDVWQRLTVPPTRTDNPTPRARRVEPWMRRSN